MKKLSKTLAAIGAAGALSLAAIPLALAQDATESTTESATESTPEEDREARELAFATRLAELLGLDATTVQEAVATVRAEQQAEHEAERLAALQTRLDEAVADGDLTQEEADAILAAAEAGVGGFGFGGGHGPGGRGGFVGPRGFGGGAPDAGADDAAATETTTA